MYFVFLRAGVAQLARALAFQAKGRGFESRFPLHNRFRPDGTGVAHVLGKDEVPGSNPGPGSIILGVLLLKGEIFLI